MYLSILLMEFALAHMEITKCISEIYGLNSMFLSDHFGVNSISFNEHLLMSSSKTSS